MTILGISIGTTRTGVCVLKDEEMIERDIHNYQASWTDNKLRIIINKYKQYILKCNVSAIILMVPPLSKHSKPITCLINRVEAMAKKHEIAFDLTTKYELKSTLLLRSNGELVRYTQQLYPDLIATYEKGKATDHKHSKRLYEAVLAAHFYQERQRVRAEQIANQQ